MSPNNTSFCFLQKQCSFEWRWMIVVLVLLSIQISNSITSTVTQSDDTKNNINDINIKDEANVQYQHTYLRFTHINNSRHSHDHSMSSVQYNKRSLQSNESHPLCNLNAATQYDQYFKDMNKIYQKTAAESTCLPIHQQCGWPTIAQQKHHHHQNQKQQSKSVNNKQVQEKLPLFVLSVGLEGAGHHLWTEILEPPIFDCVWTNARHYDRDIGDGVPKTSVSRLYDAIQEQYALRLQTGQPKCLRIYDSEDSFPTGAIRKKGRIFMRPDIVNLQLLDGVVFDTKYLIILRNITDTAMSAIRRNFFTEVDLELRTVEHTLTYLESVMRGVPCHKTMIVHYEHLMASPQTFIEPLSSFLELDVSQKQALAERLRSRKGRRVRRKPYKLTQYKECNGISDEKVCYDKIHGIMEEFFLSRQFMWPTFAANGFDFFD